MPGTSTFDAEPLFMSGPHRFSLEPQGSLVISRLSTRVFDAGSILLGPLELAVTVRGRLIAADDAGVDVLMGAIQTKLAYPPVVGTLVDLHDRTYTDMQFVRFETGDRVDRGRAVSLAYIARFVRVYDPFGASTPATGGSEGGPAV